MTALVVQGDAAHLPLPDASVDLICTSPPYFGLRSYTDGGVHYSGQIGSEATPAEFLEALWTCTHEWTRVLKPSGSIWVNLGDKYDSGTNSPRKNGGDRLADGRERQAWNTCKGGPERATIGRAKSLMGLPWRYALGCIDDLGLILRAEVIWSKPNGLPESVTDRVRRSHEQWFHFTRELHYFSAVDEIREPHTGHRGNDAKQSRSSNNGDTHRALARDESLFNPLGKLPGSVWTIPSEPLSVPDSLDVDHFAAFPTEWPRRIIQGWSPSGICTTCGEGRRPVGISTITGDRGGRKFNVCDGKVGMLGREREYAILGYACACPIPDAPTRPSVVVDPFGGTGTTALCASVLGRAGVSVDLSYDYGRLARWRTTDPGQRAKASRLTKPPVELDGQGDLFGGAA